LNLASFSHRIARHSLPIYHIARKGYTDAGGASLHHARVSSHWARNPEMKGLALLGKRDAATPITQMWERRMARAVILAQARRMEGEAFSGNDGPHAAITNGSGTNDSG
jgi:hypothetical protein